MQSAGGGALGTGRCGVFSDSLRQLDPAELLMLLLDADRPEPVRSGAHELALFLTPEPGAEVGDTVGSGEDEVAGCWARVSRGRVDGWGSLALWTRTHGFSQHPFVPGAGAADWLWRPERPLLGGGVAA